MGNSRVVDADVTDVDDEDDEDDEDVSCRGKSSARDEGAIKATKKTPKLIRGCIGEGYIHKPRKKYQSKKLTDIEGRKGHPNLY
jgi:hypothetical protein